MYLKNQLVFAFLACPWKIIEQEFGGRFTRFGHVERVFLSRTWNGEKRSYGYVGFSRREDAAKAMEVMDRKGYDNEIMRITWDQRPPRH